MPIEQWKPRVTVAAVIERDDTFLIVEEDINGNVMLNQPAGHWEDNESLIEAVIRETREETAWDFVPEALVGIYHWKHPASADTYLRFAFCGEVTECHTEQALDEGIIAANWYNLATLRENVERHRSPQLLLCIEDYLAGTRIPLDIIRVVD